MEILIILFLILLNGVFSMSEIALVSSRKFKLESEAKKGNPNARRALELSNKPNKFLSTVQIGITLIGILTGIFSGEKLTDDLRAAISRVGLLAPYADSLAVTGIVIIITYFSLVFGELIPKRIGLSFPEKIASAVAGPMQVISRIAKPFIWLLSKTNDFVLGVFGIKEKTDGIVTEEEIRSIIKQSSESGEIQEIEQDIVRRVFDLGDRKAGELMTHRSGMVWFDITDGYNQVKTTIEKEPHSVYPVVEKNLDHIVGIVSISDLFISDEKAAAFSLYDYIRKPLYVHENSPAYRVLEQFRSSRVHTAFVVDEYGAMQGIITINDIFDSLVGDVLEYDREESPITQRDENSWLVEGQIPYYELIEYFSLVDTEEPEGFNTLAGLILHLMHHIPEAGEKIQWNGFELEIVDMDDRRIDKVMIRRITG
ncbi:MAG TPA: hemolysin family protein [Sphingobacteriaceae bacterium]